MIRIENRQVFSTAGKVVHRVGDDVYFQRGTVLDADTVADFEEVDAAPVYKRAHYEAKVAELVRERYDENEEFALQRKVLNILLHPESTAQTELSTENGMPAALVEYEAYDEYVEQCKVKAKEILEEANVAP